MNHVDWCLIVLWALAIAALAVFGCAGCAGIFYLDTVTPDGLKNLHRVAPGILRVAHPDTLAKWVSLYERLEEEPGTGSRIAVLPGLLDSFLSTAQDI